MEDLFKQDPFKTKPKDGRIQISASISQEFWKVAKLNHIGWSEALRVGISMILAERGVGDYDNRLNIFRKMKKFQQLAEEYMAKHDDLKRRLEPDLEKEADEILEKKK